MESHVNNDSGKKKLIFFKDLNHCFNQSKKAYELYLREGNTYVHAKNLKAYNLKIKKLLLDNSQFLNNDLQKDADKLIEHYNAWVGKWNILKERLNPKDEDKFIFENEIRFPKEAEKRLIEMYLKSANEG